MQQPLKIDSPAAAATAIEGALAQLAAADTLPVAGLLALLAAGRFEQVRAWLRTAPAAPELPLAAARYVSWTGDLATAAHAWPNVRTGLDALLAASAADPQTAWLRTATCTELQRTATDLGDPTLAGRLHRHARSTQDAHTPAPPAQDDVASAAFVVLDFMHATLGIEPDASRHRLRIRPLLADTGRVAVHGIRFGDGGVSFDAVTSGGDGERTISLRVSQDSGGVPITVLLEPVVTGRVTATRVDDQPAGLAPRPHARGTLVPVQLVLDEPRALHLTTRNEDGPPT